MAAAGDLTRRILVAAVGVPLGAFAIRAGGWPLALILGAVAAGSAHEFYGLARARGARPFVGLGVACAGALAAVPSLFPRAAAVPLGLLLGVVLLVVFSAAATVFRRTVEDRPLEAISSTVAGALYTGGTLAFAGLLRALPDEGGFEGAALLVFPLLVTWIGDSCAYFGGRAWGRRKLAPRLSPKKTVEGALSGVVGSAAAGGLFAWLTLAQATSLPIPVAVAVAMAVVLGVVGQIGDLAESILKREAGVKDSGTLLPGHGGLLDRFDAIFFTVPLAYALVRLWGLL